MDLGVLHNELPAYFGYFTQLRPYDNPVTTLASAKGISLRTEKDYGLTYHTNARPDSSNTKTDNASPTIGSSGHTTGSNIINIFFEGAAQTLARKGDQRLGRTLGWSGPGNQSVEPDTMARGLAEALAKIKGQQEWVAREGTYTQPHAGTGGTTEVYEQRGYRYAAGITNGTATGAAGTSGTSGTYGTLDYASVMDQLQNMWDKELWTPGDRMVAVCNSTVKRALSDIFISQLNFGKNGESINVSGVNLLSFVTDFGPVDIVMTHNFPKHDLYFLNMSYMEMLGRPVPGKGLMFELPIAQTTAAEEIGIYTEIGLNYQTGSAHGRIFAIGSTVSGGHDITA